jgi:hypothetical protein
MFFARLPARPTTQPAAAAAAPLPWLAKTLFATQF